MPRLTKWVATLAFLAVAVVTTPSARAEIEVDLALVLAVDVSFSMDLEEQELQREGFLEALRSPLVHDAIQKGTLGRIALTYMEWAGATDQTIVVPWSLIDGAKGALDFAERLDRVPPRRASRTSISGAIDFSMHLLGAANVYPVRRVIDISGDGANNHGRPVAHARDDALAQGVTINGLPIMLNRPTGAWDVENLDAYYRDCVIGGSGAFMIPVRARDQFVQSVRTKIIREIAGIPEREPLIKFAETEAPANCMAGEARTQRWEP